MSFIELLLVCAPGAATVPLLLETLLSLHIAACLVFLLELVGSFTQKQPVEYISPEVFWIVGLFLLRKVSFLKIEEMKIFTTDKYLLALSKQPQKLWNPNITSCWIAYSLCSVHQWQLHVAVWMVCFSDSASLFVSVKQESFYFLCPISSTRWNYHTMAFKYNHCPCATGLLYGSSVIKRRGHTWSRWWQHHIVLISLKPSNAFLLNGDWSEALAAYHTSR